MAAGKKSDPAAELTCSDGTIGLQGIFRTTPFRHQPTLQTLLHGIRPGEQLGEPDFMPDFQHIFIADWSSRVNKRVVYVSDAAERRVRPVSPPPGGWTLDRLVERVIDADPRALVLIDVAIGLPKSLFAELCKLSGHSGIHLLDFLRKTLPKFPGEVRRPEDWTPHAPYIHVPPGNGSLTAFRKKAEECGVFLRREIDEETDGLSPLILSGIPGTVGSGSRDILQSIGNTDPAKVSVWPFDGSLAELAASGRLVIAEIYPRALYGHALLEDEIQKRGPLAIGKTKAHVRKAALERLNKLAWPRDAGVLIDSAIPERARANEDDFDAYLSALGILRLLAEGSPLEDRDALLDNIAEGGMLGVTAAQLRIRTRVLGAYSPGIRTNDAARPDPRPQGVQAGQPAVRVTTAMLNYIRQSPASAQIAFAGVSDGSNDNAKQIKFMCEGCPYVLTKTETSSCWRSRQASTEDFDSLFDLLSKTPDRYFPIEIVDYTDVTES